MSVFTVYATDTCSFCKQAKALLEEKGLEYKYIILNSKNLMEYLEDFPDAKTVPQIITPDGNKIGGYDALVDYLK
jgi:glutaredoxin